jgi:rod shape-determining protein MreD
MLTRQFSIAVPIFLTIYVIQEAFVSQIRLPGGGFSILLIFALTWAVLSETEVAAVIGFAAGFLMDLSQTAAGPFGQWTLIMLLAGYAISYIGYGDDNVQANAIGIIFFVVIANLLVEIAYIVSGDKLYSMAGFGTPVLPDDCVVNGLPRGAVPHHRGFALVGNTHGAHLARADARF